MSRGWLFVDGDVYHTYVAPEEHIIMIRRGVVTLLTSTQEDANFADRFYGMWKINEPCPAQNGPRGWVRGLRGDFFSSFSMGPVLGPKVMKSTWLMDNNVTTRQHAGLNCLWCRNMVTKAHVGVDQSIKIIEWLTIFKPMITLNIITIRYKRQSFKTDVVSIFLGTI